MKYQFFDFLLLQSISPKGSDTLGDVYESMESYMLSPVTMPCFLFSLRGLIAGGYIEVESRDGAMTPVTPVSLTQAGRGAVSVSAIQKLFGESKAIAKKEKAFCALDRPDAADIVLSAEESDFAPITQKLIKARDIAFPPFDLTDPGDGIMKLTVHHPNDDPAGIYDAEDMDPDAADLCYHASVTGHTEQIMAGMRDLIATAHALVTQPPRTRKVAIHGGDGSLLITLARNVDEAGVVSLRMTVAKIRFNRQRFYGKRDSELDYAQCGDPIFITELPDEATFAYFHVLHSAVAYPDLLTEEDRDQLSDLHHRLRDRFTM